MTSSCVDKPFKLKDDDLQTNLKFLKLIEKNECLWKHDSPNYTNNHVKVQAWKNIAKATNGTEERCSKRWRYIRQAYSEYVRASLKSTTTRKQKYYLSPHVDFVRPYVKLPLCIQAYESKIVQNKDKSQDDDLQNPKEKPEETEKLLEQQFLELIEGLGEKDTIRKTDHVIDVQSAKASSSSTNLKRKAEYYFHGSEPNAKQSKTTALKSSDINKNWMFMESILPFVDEMNKKQIRRFRRKVMLLIDEVFQIKQIDRPELLK